MNLIGTQLGKKINKILVICPHPEGYVPGQRLKYEQYFESWRNNGFEVEVSSFMSQAMQEIVYKKGFLFRKIAFTIEGYLRRVKIIFSIGKYDIVYLFLWATPFGPPFFEWVIKKLSKKIIYDIDDLVFLKNIKHENKILAFLKGKNKPIFMMRNANHVIACTPFLEEIAKKYNPQVTDISSTINTNTYIPVNKYQNDHQLILGWSGSHTTSQYLYLLTDVLLAVKNIVDFKLLVIGDPNFSIKGIDVESLSWNKEKEVELLQKIDIGLYPLPIDEEWVLGKSGLKAIQYMALGVPTIATFVGCNDRVITDNVDGFLVKTKDEWVEKLVYLIDNPSKREEIGKSARIKVLNNFSIKANEYKYLNILEETL